MSKTIQEIFTLAITKEFWTHEYRFMRLALSNMAGDDVITEQEYRKAQDEIHPLGTLHDHMVAWAVEVLWLYKSKSI